MIEIVPNWHPLFVHFTVALLSTAGILFIVVALAPAQAKWQRHCLIVARWNLWIGAILTIATVIAGFDAYNTVTHDDPSHAAMANHRNWALATATSFFLLAGWSFFERQNPRPAVLFTPLIAAAVILLGITGWKGGELVFRHGMGVMSLPSTDTHGHGATSRDNSSVRPKTTTPSEHSHDNDHHH